MPSAGADRAALRADSPSRRPRGAGGIAWVVVASLLCPTFAYAEPPAPKGAPPPEAAVEAHQHAERAHSLYQQGLYRESIAELEAALKLDPTGKGLVFNLGVVHEKLGDIDDALRYFQRYEQMDLDPQERAKADAYVKRLQGARREVEKPSPEPSPPPTQTIIALPAAPAPAHGRMDAFTVGAAALAAGGFAVGTVFGLKAVADKPKSGYVTSGPGSYLQLQANIDHAHREAIIADAAFGVGVAATALAAILFFARTRNADERTARKAGSEAFGVVLSAGVSPQGGALFLGARF